jgi:zinc D-Ala-D-Ala carboxypeptidase
MKNPSSNTTWAELTKSQTAERFGISNKPTPSHAANLVHICQTVFEPCREFVGGPLHISSGYRSRALNNKIAGSSKTSDHLTGNALDLDCDHFGNGDNASLFRFILDNLSFSQLIWEHGDNPLTSKKSEPQPAWVHVSRFKDESLNTGDVLVATKDAAGRTIYRKYVQ